MSEIITLKDDHCELTFEVNRETIIEIPFFTAYFSEQFTKNIIHVPNAKISQDIIQNISHQDPYDIIERLICEDYLGITSDLSILSKINIPSSNFIFLIDYFGYHPELVKAISRNLDDNLEEILKHDRLPDLLSYYGKEYLVISYDNTYEFYDTDLGKVVDQYNKEDIRKAINVPSFGWNICVTPDLFVTHSGHGDKTYVIDPKKSILKYSIEHYDVGISRDQRILFEVHLEYIVLEDINDGKIIKKIFCEDLNRFTILSWDSKNVITVTKERITFIDIESEKITKQIKINTKNITGVKFLCFDKFAVIKGDDNIIVDTEVGIRIFHSYGVFYFLLSPDCTKIFVKNRRHHCEIINIATGNTEFEPKFVGSCVCFIGNKLFHEYDGNIYSFNIVTGEEKMVLSRNARGLVNINVAKYIDLKLRNIDDAYHKYHKY